MSARSLTYRALPGVAEVAPGDDLAAITANALQSAGLALEPGDVLVYAQKIVSKAEGRFVRLDTVSPSPQAQALAAHCGKDPRFVELVLGESSAVVRVAPNVLITRHRRGYVMANAGIDHSNTGAGPDTVLLLPVDPDASAIALRESLARRTGVAPGVIVGDSFGRPWRLGTVNVALGIAGVASLVDMRGGVDRDGRTLLVTQVAVADAIAAGAGLAMGEATESTPIVHVRGVPDLGAPGRGTNLLRPPDEDLFT
jgi:coenzyme F420-0:L-glutamate ligase/coenzyme F420-1:gamma-L-glutamate ligase